MRVIIVGGVAGGASAAARLRRLDEQAEIIIFEKSGFVSYANCGLPYFIGGEITDPGALTLQSPQSFHTRFHIDVRVKHEVIALFTEAKMLTVKNLETGKTVQMSYDKLILSPGAKPIDPKIPGTKGDRFFTLRSVENTLAIRNFVVEQKPKTALIVGGGYIGLEMAENLCAMGVRPTIVQLSDHVMQQIDADMASEVHVLLRSNHVNVILNDTVTSFETTDNMVLANLHSGQVVSAEMVLLAIGVTPDTRVAKAAELSLGTKDAIQVNEHMLTSDPDIYAVGDAVEVVHYITKKPSVIPLAGPANKQGRIAADHICGISSSFRGIQGSSVIKLFDMTVAVTGITEDLAKATGLTYDKVVIYSFSHATYYPGATSMTIKALFHPESGKILGVQIVGREGVDKRCDIFATAIRAGMTAYDLTQLELCYAPPYSAAKDPVNMVGFVIENLLTGKVKQFHWDEVEELKKNPNVSLLDVRRPDEFSQGHIEGAIHIPVDELRERMQELNREKPIYVNCHSGLRSYLACRMLQQHGFVCFNLSGGYQFYHTVMTDMQKRQKSTKRF